VVNAVLQRQSLLVLGEAGAGKTTLARASRDMLSACGVTAPIVSYQGAAKQFYVDLAGSLGCDTTRSSGSQKSAQELRDDLVKYVVADSVAVLIDDAERMPASVRYWVQDCLTDGAVIVLFAFQPKSEGIFIKIPRIEMSAFSFESIRDLMYQEAQIHNVTLNPAVFTSLATRAGGNPTLARRLVRELAIGVEEDTTDGTQYVDGTPFLIGLLSMISIVRFIGIGLGDKSLYVVGGIFATGAIALRIVLYQSNRRTKRLL
jgi:hypothetical protein